MNSAPGISVETDLDRIDLDIVHRWLSTDAYWALGRSREKVQRAAQGSLNFGAFDSTGALCGYARVVTDHATFAWLCDVYVPSSHRGGGVGGRLVQAVVDTLTPMGLTRIVLATSDAHAVYARAGFEPYPDPRNLMALFPGRPPR